MLAVLQTTEICTCSLKFHFPPDCWNGALAIFLNQGWLGSSAPAQIEIMQPHGQ